VYVPGPGASVAPPVIPLLIVQSPRGTMPFP
jgi:hypothetical protein